MKIFFELLKYYIYLVVIFFIGRVGLFFLYFDRIKNSDVNIYLSFLYGLKMDTIVACVFLIIPTIVLTLFPKELEKFVEKFLKFYFALVIGVAVFIENATYPFFAMYDVRPNYLFVEYLKYPKEVSEMILKDYWLLIIIAIFMIAIVLKIFFKYNKFNFKEILNIPYFKRALMFFPLMILLFIGIRSSFGHRPANIADAMISSNRVLNEITKNSIYSIGYAIYAKNKFESNISTMYGNMDIDEAFKRVKDALGIKAVGRSLARVEKTHFPSKKKKNLIIFLQESLGYQFISKEITPNLYKLKNEGIWLDNLFSNGTRSVRGIAGIVSGIFSIPGEGVVKRNKSQSGFFTFSKLLKPLGYETSFIYGGESRFDNMRGWFLGNGFDRVIDNSVIKEYSFKGTWGICDEDVVKYADKYFTSLYKKGKNFASIIFSTSNHTPFDFPKGKIKLIKGVKEKSVQNAIKYADFAIGRLIELAKRHSYYQDSVIVIVADHNIRVYGDDVVPVNMFHIPGLILGGDVKPMFYTKLSTQPDLLSTALDLLGKDFKYPIMGRSIFNQDKKELSLMQFNNYYALRIKNKVAVLKDDKSLNTYLYLDNKNLGLKQKHLRKISHDKNLEQTLLAFVVVLDYLYKNQLYK